MSRVAQGVYVRSVFDLVAAPEEQGTAAARRFAAALIAEAARLQDAGLNLLIIDDGFDGAGPHGLRLDAIVVASFLSQHVPGMAIVVGTPVAYLEPFHVAKRVQTLDFSTHGYAGWLVSEEATVTGFDIAGSDDRDLRAQPGFVDEFIDVTVKLFDSWEDGSLVLDVERGFYSDPAKVHTIDHVGRFQSVRGPSLTPRSPQGRVPIVRFLRDGKESVPHGADVLLLDPERVAPPDGVPALSLVPLDRVSRAPSPAVIDVSDGSYLADPARVIAAIAPRDSAPSLRTRLGLGAADNQFATVALTT